MRWLRRYAAVFKGEQMAGSSYGDALMVLAFFTPLTLVMGYAYFLFLQENTNWFGATVETRRGPFHLSYAHNLRTKALFIDYPGDGYYRAICDGLSHSYCRADAPTYLSDAYEIRFRPMKKPTAEGQINGVLLSVAEYRAGNKVQIFTNRRAWTNLFWLHMANLSLLSVILWMANTARYALRQIIYLEKSKQVYVRRDSRRPTNKDYDWWE